ncbi:MAG TPA: GIY-YIG nuclease family protein [Chthoniobacterales bacterium]|nr:GIY-YIG nuclease family protein [Chthoniobacterales bacterium]
MHYVYILESIARPEHYYIRYTTDLRQRVRKHQAEVSSHAAKYRPWKLKAYFAFETEDIARRFERYLKSGSGVQFRGSEASELRT